MFNNEKFRNLRKNHKLLQSDIASKMNVSLSTVGMWEQGRNQPDTDTVKKLANLFGVSTDYLLDNDVEEDKNKELLQAIANDLSNPLNKAIYSKASELKTDKDRQIVLSIIEGFIKGIDENK